MHDAKAVRGGTAQCDTFACDALRQVCTSRRRVPIAYRSEGPECPCSGYDRLRHLPRWLLPCCCGRRTRTRALEAHRASARAAAGNFSSAASCCAGVCRDCGERSRDSGTKQTYPGGSLGGLFSRPGLLGGFAAGFLGSGVLGLLFGHGFVGELGSVASIIGRVFQLALIALLCRLIWESCSRPQRAGLFRPVAAAIGRSLPALAPRISSRRRGAAQRRRFDNHRVVSK